MSLLCRVGHLKNPIRQALGISDKVSLEDIRVYKLLEAKFSWTELSQPKNTKNQSVSCILNPPYSLKEGHVLCAFEKSVSARVINI